MTPTPSTNLQPQHEYFHVIHNQSHAARQTTHNDNQAHSKQRKTHTQKQGKSNSNFKPDSLTICT